MNTIIDRIAEEIELTAQDNCPTVEQDFELRGDLEIPRGSQYVTFEADDVTGAMVFDGVDISMLNEVVEAYNEEPYTSYAVTDHPTIQDQTVKVRFIVKSVKLVNNAISFVIEWTKAEVNK